jgi:hypothetical protein
MPAVAHRSEPWDPRVAVCWALLALGGLVLSSVGWNGAANEAFAQDQIGWCAWSATGLVVAGMALIGWVASGRTAVAHRRRALLRAGRFGPDELAGTSPATTRERPEIDDGLVAVPGTIRYHRTTCLLVSGKAVVVALRGDHEAQGRRACEACRP